MKIKTVCEEIGRETTPAFDEQVNALLEDGWHLAKREIIPGYSLCGDLYFPPALYAELVKLDEADMAADLAELREAEPVTWQEAVEVIKETCRDAVACDKSCPAYEWCQKNIPDSAPPPETWSDPE